MSRRRFLAAGGVAAGLAMVAAGCSSDGDGGDGGTRTTGAGPEPTLGATGDAGVAELGAGLEKLIVDTYAATLIAASAGRLGAVPPAVAELMSTARAHHDDHLRQWNNVLKSAGRPEIDAPYANLGPTIAAALAETRDVAGAVKLALSLEEVAADTYNRAIPRLAGKDVVKLAAQIQVVDQQHRAILLFTLGLYPVPEVFQNTDKAAS